ncbi:DNA-directed DNA polymerase [Powellomyces hirtus]|uniref:DNA-directed DNA polymerase n=1 Tax=Powellomyces hirtus TaxID=109895 RepID=A0A507DQS9_9FUNG|nr:DNA-directed DNA polymerase [Powellomyces hirtus]
MSGLCPNWREAFYQLLSWREQEPTSRLLGEDAKSGPVKARLLSVATVRRGFMPWDNLWMLLPSAMQSPPAQLQQLWRPGIDAWSISTVRAGQEGPGPGHGSSRSAGNRTLLNLSLGTGAFRPMRMLTIGGACYFVLFIDDKSRAVFPYLLKTKAETLPSFKIFAAATATETGCSLKVLQSDHGGEYLSKAFSNLTQSLDIRHQLSSVATPQQNGVAQRMNRTLVEMARWLLLQAGLPYKFWGEALMTAAYLRNRSPTRALHNKAPPWQIWTGTRPNIQHLHIFCCTAYASLLKKNQHKVGPNATRCIFLQTTKGYRLWNEAAGNLIESRDIRLPLTWQTSCQMLKMSFLSKGWCQKMPLSREASWMVALSKGREDLEDAHEHQAAPCLNGAQPASDSPLERTGSLLAEATGLLAEAIAPGEDEPASLKAAPKALMQGRHQPIKCKWVFKIKRAADGSRQCYRARLVAKGFSQRQGVDYGETFAPVAKFGSVRMVLAIAAIKNMELEQMDAVTGFLNPNIEEEIYMEQPEGFAIAGQEDLVCCLRRSLYGLKQSSRNWNQLLDARLKQLGFVQSNADNCIYTPHAQDPKSALYLLVYVDDMILTSKSMVQINRIKTELSRQFKMTDMGALGLFLGVEITRDCPSRRLWLSQKHYLQNVLASFGMDNCKPVSTPMETSTRLTKAMEPQSNEERAQTASHTVPELDLAASVGSVSQFVANPGPGHWQAVKRILCSLWMLFSSWEDPSSQHQTWKGTLTLTGLAAQTPGAPPLASSSCLEAL